MRNELNNQLIEIIDPKSDQQWAQAVLHKVATPIPKLERNLGLEKVRQAAIAGESY
jgi:hypothetical protein